MHRDTVVRAHRSRVRAAGASACQQHHTSPATLLCATCTACKHLCPSAHGAWRSTPVSVAFCTRQVTVAAPRLRPLTAGAQLAALMLQLCCTFAMGSGEARVVLAGSSARPLRRFGKELESEVRTPLLCSFARSSSHTEGLVAPGDRVATRPGTSGISSRDGCTGRGVTGVPHHAFEAARCRGAHLQTRDPYAHAC